MKFTLRPKEGESRHWPAYLFGRMRTSTVVLLIAFFATWWTYYTYQPASEPETPTQVVPPGFVPDPAYTWVPRTNVQTRPPTTTTTTTETTTPTTETTEPEGAETSPATPGPDDTDQPDQPGPTDTTTSIVPGEPLIPGQPTTTVAPTPPSPTPTPTTSFPAGPVPGPGPEPTTPPRVR